MPRELIERLFEIGQFPVKVGNGEREMGNSYGNCYRKMAVVNLVRTTPEIVLTEVFPPLLPKPSFTSVLITMARLYFRRAIEILRRFHEKLI